MKESKRSVLVVDDEEAMREILCRILQREVYECVAASSGKEALEKAAVQDFDVVLLDILMPGLSGVDVLRRLVERHPRPQVIMVTSAVDIDMIQEVMRLGACDYVVKPFNTHDLLGRVEKALEKKRALNASTEHTS